MSRFLLVTMPIPGHVAPMSLIARELTRRHHEVVWYSSSAFRNRIEATGAQFRPIRSTVDYGDGDYDRHFPGRAALSGLKQVVFDFEHAFVGLVEGYVTDLREIAAEFSPDALIADPAVSAAWVLDEVDGLPTATLNVTVLGLQSPDVPPFGLGLGPARSALGRLRNRALYRLVDAIVFRSVNRAFRSVARRNGWPVHPYRPRATAGLYLQPSVPALEYADSHLPTQVHFIGPLLPPAPADVSWPDWWDDLRAAKASGVPVVVVTQGTIATDPTQLIQPTLEVLAEQPVLVVVAGADPTALQHIPSNARVSRYLPFVDLLPYADVLVTNGGYGGVTTALAFGVPVVSAGTTEDKAEVGARVRHAGVGIRLRTSRPTRRQLRSAVDAVLTDGRYRRAAQRIQLDFRAHDAAGEAADLAELLAVTRQPVLAVPQQQRQPQPH